MYDIGTLSLWIGVGVALIVGGIQAAGWRHRVLITGLIILGALCVLAALAVPPLASKWPAIAGFMSNAATPSSWFMLLLLVAGYVLIGPQFGQRAKKIKEKPHAEDDAGEVEYVEPAELRSEIESLITSVVTSLRNEIDGVRKAATTAQDSTKVLGVKIAHLSGDMKSALSYVSDSSAFRLLTWVLARYPSGDFDYTGPEDTRRSVRAQFDMFVDETKIYLKDTRWAKKFDQLLNEAKSAAEDNVFHAPKAERPSGVDTLEWQQCVISRERAAALRRFLSDELGLASSALINQCEELDQLFRARRIVNLAETLAPQSPPDIGADRPQ